MTLSDEILQQLYPGRLPQAEIDRLRPYGQPVPFEPPTVSSTSLLEATDAEIAAVRAAIARSLGHDPDRLRACHDVSFALCLLFAGGWPEGGRFIGPRGPYERWGKRGGPHTWVRLADGSLVDPTADQYGHEPVLRLPPGDPRQAWYEVHQPVITAEGLWKFPEYGGGPHGPVWPDEARPRFKQRAPWPNGA